MYSDDYDDVIAEWQEQGRGGADENRSSLFGGLKRIFGLQAEDTGQTEPVPAALTATVAAPQVVVKDPLPEKMVSPEVFPLDLSSDIVSENLQEAPDALAPEPVDLTAIHTAEIKEILTTTTPLTPDQTGRLQALLKAEDLYDKKIDHDFGKSTAAGTVAFLQKNPDMASLVSSDIYTKLINNDPRNENKEALRVLIGENEGFKNNITESTKGLLDKGVAVLSADEKVQLQTNLSLLGHYDYDRPGKLEIDGELGGGSRKAIQSFEAGQSAAQTVQAAPVAAVLEGEKADLHASPVFQDAAYDPRPLIAIDPGHRAGNDKGATFNGVYEQDIIDPIAARVGAYLKEWGHRVSFTRNPGERLGQGDDTLRFRSDSAHDQENQTGAPYTVLTSIHVNSYHDASVHGPRVYVDNSPTKDGLSTKITNPESAQLATHFEQHLSLNGKDAVMDTADFAVLDQMEHGDTSLSGSANEKDAAILVEAGFGTNPEDLQTLIQNPDIVARQIALSMHSYVQERSGAQLALTGPDTAPHVAQTDSSQQPAVDESVRIAQGPSSLDNPGLGG